MTRSSRLVRFGEVTYPFYVRAGLAALTELSEHLTALGADRFLVVADVRAGLPVRDRTIEAIQSVAPVIELSLDCSEGRKNLSTVDELADAALLAGISRRTCVVAIGGGVVGNVAGLLAALLFRGIRLIHIPTTLLAMSDSVLSTKQGVNSQHGKNHLGAFHPPELVWNQLDFIDTLPPDEIRAAMCETIKNVLAICPEYLPTLDSFLNPEGRYDHIELDRILEFCLSAKMQVMRTDLYEKHSGLVLEYGHTVGHALENLSRGQLRHGYAVGLGMLAAAQISAKAGWLSAQDLELHYRLLCKNGAPTSYAGQASINEVLQVLRRDNKRGYLAPTQGIYDFVLLAGLGSPRTTGDSVLSQINEAQIVSALNSIVEHSDVAKVA